MRLPLVLLAFATASLAHAQPAPDAVPRYAEVRLAAGTDLPGRLAAAGVHLDHVATERSADGVWLRTVLREDDLAAAQAAGIEVRVLVADLAAAYAERAERVAGCPATPFPITGSMGCYPTFAQAVAILDEMRAQYPTLVAPKLSIGTSHEGRDIWMVEIGDNPGVDEGEPEVLLNALHHAREPQGLASLLHAVWTALDGYGSDPEWTSLLDSRRIFLVPVLNPDGYVFNETTNPGGGGFWRKNRRANGGNVFGVDLNRNYGYEWGYSDSGSSPFPDSDVYRGPSAFSEPETAALRDFVEAHDIRLALNTHTYGDYLIYPWGYEADLYTPDSAAFVDAARVMTSVNGFTAGTVNQTLNYLTNGGSDDWMYGAEGILAYTPEIGSQFWPSPDQILPIAELNVDMYRQAIRLAGPAPTAALAALTDNGGDTNGYPDPGEYVLATLQLGNAGRGAATIDYARLISTTPDLVPVPGTGWAVVTLPPGTSTVVAEPLPLTVRLSAPLGDVEGLALEVTLADGTVQVLPLGPVRVGTPEVLYATDASSLTGWTATGGWGLTTAPVVSPPSAFADSPFGDYSAGADARLTLADPVDLSGARGSALEVSARWDIESGYDFATVEASLDGTFWTPLAGRFTRPGSGSSIAQPAGVPGYDGQQSEWVRERLDLSAFDGQSAVRLRFRLRSDSGVEGDGIVVDDLAVTRLVNGGTVAGENVPGVWSTALGAPSPNPSAGPVRVGVVVAQSGPVDLAVYDVLGRRVRTLWAGTSAAGPSSMEWDGRDAQGAPVAPGLYVVRLVADGDTVARQVLVVR